jgi:hypothetical protein
MQHLTAIIEREDKVYVALCPELNVASQGIVSRKPVRTLRRQLSSSLRRRIHRKLVSV